MFFSSVALKRGCLRCRKLAVVLYSGIVSLIVFREFSAQVVVSKGLPSIKLIFTCSNEKLVLEVLKFGRSLLVDKTSTSALAGREERVDAVSLSCVLDQDLLPGGEEFVGLSLRDSFLYVAAFEIVSVDGGARELLVFSDEAILVGLFHDVKGHLDQVVSGVGFDTAGILHETLVLLAVRLEEKTFASKAGHLGSGNLSLMLVDNARKLLVGTVLGFYSQG